MVKRSRRIAAPVSSLAGEAPGIRESRSRALIKLWYITQLMDARSRADAEHQERDPSSPDNRAWLLVLPVDCRMNSPQSPMDNSPATIVGLILMLSPLPDGKPVGAPLLRRSSRPLETRLQHIVCVATLSYPRSPMDDDRQSTEKFQADRGGSVLNGPVERQREV